MVNVALFVNLEAKPGKETEVERFLMSGLQMVQEEPATTAWFGIRLGQSTFGIFDAFPNEQGRQAHLAGRLAAALMKKVPELLASPPVIQEADILAAKLPKATLRKPVGLKVGAAIGLASVAAAGWLTARRFRPAPSTPYETIARKPVTTPL